MKITLFYIIMTLLLPLQGHCISDEELKAREKILKEFQSSRKNEAKKTTELEQKKAVSVVNPSGEAGTANKPNPNSAKNPAELINEYTKNLSPEQLEAVDQVKNSLLKNKKVLEAAEGDDSSIDKDNEQQVSQKKEESSSDKSSYFGSNFMTDMMSANIKDQFVAILKNNPLKLMEDEELKQKILSVTGDSFAGKIVAESPNFLNGFVEWLKNDEALSALFGVLNRPDQMKKYGIMCIFYFIVAFILNLKNNEGNLLKRLMMKICIMMGTSTLTLITFYLLFSENIKPTITIFSKHLL